MSHVLECALGLGNDPLTRSGPQPFDARGFPLSDDSASTWQNVDFFRGFAPSAAACSITSVVGAGVSSDFCTRTTPTVACNATCNPQLTAIEGKAVVFTAATIPCQRVTIDPRLYFLNGTTSDTGVAAVSNGRVVSP